MHDDEVIENELESDRILGLDTPVIAGQPVYFWEKQFSVDPKTLGIDAIITTYPQGHKTVSCLFRKADQ